MCVGGENFKIKEKWQIALRTQGYPIASHWLVRREAQPRIRGKSQN